MVLRPCSLALYMARVRILEQSFNVLAVVGENADAQAASNGEGVALNDKFGGHGLDDAFRHRNRVGGLSYGGHQDQRLVASQAGHGIGCARPLKTLGNFLQ